MGAGGGVNIPFSANNSGAERALPRVEAGAAGELANGHIDHAHAGEDITAEGWVRSPCSGRRSAGEQHSAGGEIEAHGGGLGCTRAREVRRRVGG